MNGYLTIVIVILLMALIVGGKLLYKPVSKQSSENEEDEILERIKDVCLQYFHAKSWEEASTICVNNKDVMTGDEAQEFFSAFRHMALSEGDLHLLPIIDEKRFWLLSCRDEGLEKACDELPEISCGEALDAVYEAMVVRSDPDISEENALEYLGSRLHASPEILDLMYGVIESAMAKSDEETLELANRVHRTFFLKEKKEVGSDGKNQQEAAVNEKASASEMLKIAGLYYEKAEFEEKRGKLDRTEVCYLNALRVYQSLRFRKGKASAYFQLGCVMMEQERYFDAILSLQSCIEIANEIHHFDHMQRASRQLSKCQRNVGNYDAARNIIDHAYRISVLAMEPEDIRKNLLKRAALAAESGDTAAMEELRPLLATYNMEL